MLRALGLCGRLCVEPEPYIAVMSTGRWPSVTLPVAHVPQRPALARLAGVSRPVLAKSKGNARGGPCRGTGRGLVLAMPMACVDPSWLPLSLPSHGLHGRGCCYACAHPKRATWRIPPVSEMPFSVPGNHSTWDTPAGTCSSEAALEAALCLCCSFLGTRPHAKRQHRGLGVESQLFVKAG